MPRAECERADAEDAGPASEVGDGPAIELAGHLRVPEDIRRDLAVCRVLFELYVWPFEGSHLREEDRELLLAQDHCALGRRVY